MPAAALLIWGGCWLDALVLLHTHYFSGSSQMYQAVATLILLILTALPAAYAWAETEPTQDDAAAAEPEPKRPTFEELSTLPARERFRAAERALRDGERALYRRLREGLRDYPLYPDLYYAELSGRIDSADKDELTRFLGDFAGSRAAERLRAALQKRYAAQGRWQDWLKLDRPGGGVSEDCRRRHAWLETGKRERAFDGLADIWLNGRSLPNSCDPLFLAWHEAGGLSRELVWQRASLAMRAGQSGVIRFMRRYLPEEDHALLEVAVEATANPLRVLSKKREHAEHPELGRVLCGAVARAARSKPDAAAGAFKRIKAEYKPADEHRDLAAMAIGLAYANKDDPRAIRWLDRINGHQIGNDLLEARLRAGVKLKLWTVYTRWMDDAPAELANKTEWQYWKARSLELRGYEASAKAAFAEVTPDRSLWAFLAAERAGKPFEFGERTVPVSDAQRRAIVEGGVFARMREFKALGRERAADAEWRALLGQLDLAGRMAAAKLASERGEHRRAILTLARTDYWDDLKIRFPIEHRPMMRVRALIAGVPEPWLFAVMRQESLLDPLIRSQVGATGLMQLMPATARSVARRMGHDRPSVDDLKQPRHNLLFGSAYLARMARRYDGNAVLATAAYNAGPGNVDKWLPDETMDADLWIMSIPFRETRTYVRRVLAYRVIYAHRLGLEPTPLRQVMQAIPGRAD